jgi:maltooligosyltrehalose trehalohydrolase
MTAYLLLSPGVPLLFQGQEFCSEKPFLYFADHQGELGRMVRKGRAEYLANFPSLASPDMQARLDDPASPETFRRCVIDPGEWRRNGAALALHRDLIALRRELFACGPRRIDGATLGDHAWMLRYFANDGDDDALLIVNLGADQWRETIPEPLLAPHEGRTWRLMWSSEHPDYGGAGMPLPLVDDSWHIIGHAAVVLVSGET